MWWFVVRWVKVACFGEWTLEEKPDHVPMWLPQQLNHFRWKKIAVLFHETLCLVDYTTSIMMNSKTWSIWLRAHIKFALHIFVELFWNKKWVKNALIQNETWLLKNDANSLFQLNLQNTDNILHLVKLSHYRTGQTLWAPGGCGSQNFRQYMKVIRLSALCQACLSFQEISLVLTSVRGRVDPRAIVKSEGFGQWKIPMTPSGIETATIWLVPLCFNLLCHCVPQNISVL